MSDEDRLRKAADLARLYAGVEGQIREHGLGGISDLIETHERVRRGLRDVSPYELDRALVDVGHLLDRLRLISSRLEALGEMKRILLGQV
jgi:hypothetical protein